MGWKVVRGLLRIGAGVLLLALAGTRASAQDLTLTGVMTRADWQTYREVPFKVPPGTTRLTVEFSYDGKDGKAVIDLGVRDPQRFRGWSGGNKQAFTISEAEATPSYLPGLIPAGTWKLVLGVPNMREGGQARYTAHVHFERGSDFEGFAAAPIKAGPGWYRGDLHLHTGHSDGSCASDLGKRTPCPVFKTLEAAHARGLDFVAVTDHNTISHAEALRELAGYFDDLLLIPGREVTTFHGHFNVWGPVAALDFQLGSPRAPTLATIQDEVAKAHGLISINHPGQPSGEACMGCGWTVPDTDYSRVAAVEAVNGGSLRFPPGGAENPIQGVAFWEARLNAGLRLTAVGGSDNHDAGLDPARPSAVGYPTTVVHAQALSQPAILEAIRAGHAFVDVDGTRDRRLEVTAVSGGRTAEMGDALAAPAGAPVRITVHVLHAAGSSLSLSGDGPKPKLADATFHGDDATIAFEVVGDGARHWLRADVRGPDGKIQLLGNPIYFNAP